VTWLPYYLNKTPPDEPEEQMHRWVAKYGVERAEALADELQTLGAKDGIEFTFRGKLGKTRDSHRIIELAKRKGPRVENDVVDSIFKAYFEEGGDITSWGMLVAAAARAGLDDEDEVKSWLRGGEGGDEVDRHIEETHALGLQGVPHFIIADGIVVEGCEDKEVYLEELVKAKAAATGQPVPTDLIVRPSSQGL
jgi:predicted DsbA family dithiol-disulfide isomerase